MIKPNAFDATYTHAQRVLGVPDQDAIMADLFCAQSALDCNIGDKMFNNDDIYPELDGDDYADQIMRDLNIN